MPKSLYGRWRAERLVLIPDVNILVYAHNSRAREHAQAREWWEKTLAGRRPVGIPWVTILGFIRIMTNRKIVENPMHVKFAILRVRGLHPHHDESQDRGESHAREVRHLARARVAEPATRASSYARRPTRRNPV